MNDFVTGCIIGAILGIADQWFVFICLVLLEIFMWAISPAEAHCYSIWHYLTPQHCGAYALAKPVPLPPHWERIAIPLPDLNFEACPEGDERLRGIAFLRALNDGPAP